MANSNDPGTAPQPGRSDSGIEDSDQPTKQAPGYNELERVTGDAGGDTDQIEPTWRPGDDPAGQPAAGGMQGEGEPGRGQPDSAGGIEGAAGSEES